MPSLLLFLRLMHYYFNFFLLCIALTGCHQEGTGINKKPLAGAIELRTTESDRAFERYLQKDFDGVGKIIDATKAHRRTPELNALALRLEFVRFVLNASAGGEVAAEAAMRLRPEKYEINHVALEELAESARGSIVIKHLFADSCEELGALYDGWLVTLPLDATSKETFERRSKELGQQLQHTLEQSLAIDNGQALVHARLANRLLQNNNRVDQAVLSHAISALEIDSSIPSPVSILLLAILKNDSTLEPSMEKAKGALSKLTGEALTELKKNNQLIVENIGVMEKILEEPDNARRSELEQQKAKLEMLLNVTSECLKECEVQQEKAK